MDTFLNPKKGGVVKKLATTFAVGCLLFASADAPDAHEPEGVLHFLWQWPEGMPILDTNLSEWDVVPEEYWFDNDSVEEGTLYQTEPGNSPVTTGVDPARLSFRFVPTANAADDRFYWAYERFDDSWTGWSDLEPKIDADHSAGSFWFEEGQTEEEQKRAKSRGAQPYHLFFSDGAQQGPGDWAWNWQTAADWYEDPRFMDASYSYTGEPLSQEEFTLVAEFYLPGFNDFKWDDPDYSFDNIHDIEEGQIVGIATCVYDTYADCDCGAEGTECCSRWNLGTFTEDFGDADFFTDFLVMPIDEDTAVKAGSWGVIKASMQR